MERHTSKKYDSLVFDLGGVLYDIDVNRTVKAFADMGIAGFEQYYTLQNQTGIIDSFEKGLLGEAAFAEAVNALTGSHFTLDEIRKAWNALLIGMPASSVQTLKDLRQMGYNLYLLSNTNAYHMNAINREMELKYGIPALAHLVDKAWYSFEMGMRKPDAEIYKTVLASQLFDSQKAIFLDDNQANINSANHAGLNAVHKPMDQPLAEALWELGIL